jgi:hypothetical protein
MAPRSGDGTLDKLTGMPAAPSIHCMAIRRTPWSNAPHGICKMHITVSAAGAVSAIEIAPSTGSEALGQACKEAIYQSPFVAARDGNQRSEAQPRSRSSGVAGDVNRYSIVWTAVRESEGGCLFDEIHALAETELREDGRRRGSGRTHQEKRVTRGDVVGET